MGAPSLDGAADKENETANIPRTPVLFPMLQESVCSRCYLRCAEFPVRFALPDLQFDARQSPAMGDVIDAKLDLAIRAVEALAEDLRLSAVQCSR